MIFDPPLISGTLIKRYKRFLCDVALDSGEILTAHCPNPGAMLGLTTPEERIYLSRSPNPSRKLAYTWEMIQTQTPLYGQPTNHTLTYIGMNTMNPNRLVEEALKTGFLNSFVSYSSWKTEVSFGTNSRIDFVLTTSSGDLCFVEVKNVHLCRQKGLAEFPDCVTERGAKHLGELAVLKEKGIRSMVIYVIQRNDCDSFQVASDLDPRYGKAALIAHEVGVETLAFGCLVTPQEIKLSHSLAVRLPK